MTTVTVLLNSIDKVKSFVDTISVYDCEFDLVSGRYIIDAKSILGILSLELSKPVNLTIYTDKEAELTRILTSIQDFLVS